MKKFALLFNASLAFQAIENSELQTAFDYTKYTILIILFVAASVVMMLIPVILFYSAVDNFITINAGKRRVKNEMCCQEINTRYLKSICNKYLIASTRFFKNSIALAAWNVFSLIYIVFGFDSFSNGLKEYFYFPLNAIESLIKDNFFDSMYEFQSNWVFMVAIVLLTFSFSFLGKYIGNNVARKTIKNVELS